MSAHIHCSASSRSKPKLKEDAAPFITRSRDFYKQDICQPSYLKDIFTAGIVISKRMEKTRDSKNHDVLHNGR